MSHLSRHVLIVDDYPDALEVWTMFLQASGYSVSAAASGRAALEQADLRTPHAIVLDLQLPDVSGLDVARTLRQRPLTANVPLIALTGRGLPQDIEAARAAGFDAVLIKPCEPSALLAEMERIVAVRSSGTAG